MQEISRCVSCDYQTHDVVSQCPQCGSRVRTAKQSRRQGWFQIVLGSFLVALMGVITFVIAGIAAGSSQPGATTRFTGSSSDLTLIYGIFAIVIAIGLLSIASGVMRIRYGKTNMMVFVVMILLAVVLYFVAMAFNRSNN
jgi:hypothetical protein